MTLSLLRTLQETLEQGNWIKASLPARGVQYLWVKGYWQEDDWKCFLLPHRHKPVLVRENLTELDVFEHFVREYNNMYSLESHSWRFGRQTLILSPF